MKKQHILFDLDGTLTDSQEGIMNSIEYAMKHFGIRVEDRSQLRPFLGPPLADSMEKYYGFDRDKGQEFVVKYRECFDQRGWAENRVYPGVEAMLQALREHDCRLYVATSKPETAARRILKHFELSHYFEYIGGASLDSSRVHKGDVIRYVLDTNQLTAGAVMMVGDRENDVRGAKENALECIGVLYGYGDRRELEQAGADHLAETAQKVAELLI